MRNQVADLCADRDYWRQASDHWRVAFETTQRQLAAPKQLEDMRSQVADLCADRDYWRQASDHWRVAFETTQRLLPAPVERGTTTGTNWRMVFGQLCSTWAGKLATAVVSWRGVFGRLWSIWAAQLARQREHWLGERRGRPARHSPGHGYWQRGLGNGDAGDDREMPSYLFGRGYRGHAQTRRSVEAADLGALLPEHGGDGGPDCGGEGEGDGELEQDAERMVGRGIAYHAAPPRGLSIADKAVPSALDEVREVGQLHAGGDEAKIHSQFRQGNDPVTEHDKKLFRELSALLSSNGAIGFRNRHNMAGWLVRDAELEPLNEFHERWSAPERTFIAPELERARQALWSKVRDYLCVIAVETVPTNTPSWRSVPSEWEEEQPERFERVAEKLHVLAAEIVDLHADLVRVGRKHLIGAAKLPFVSPRTLSRHALPN
jgi:hypothetical protein